MHLIAKKALRAFWEANPDAEASLLAWYKAASKAQWTSLAEVKKIYSLADLVSPYIGFNIRGNSWIAFCTAERLGQYKGMESVALATLDSVANDISAGVVARLATICRDAIRRSKRNVLF